MGEKVCCCHSVTGAAVVGCLQLIILGMTLSASGLILDRYRLWESFEPFATQSTVYTTTKSNATVQAVATRWAIALVEISMAWYCSFCAVWFLTLLILCLSFKYYRPVFVIPNFVALVVAIIADLFAAGVLLGRVLDVSKAYQTTEYEEVIMIYFIAFLFFSFIVLLFCLFFIAHFHKFLKETNGLVLPVGNRRLDDSKAWE